MAKSKKKSLKLSKPAESLPKDLKNSKPGWEKENLSQKENISADIENSIPNETQDFAAAINQSRDAILEADSKASGKRGRKPLPRDASGNIIRDASPPPLGAAPPVAPLNQASIEENKILVRQVFPVVNNAAEKYAGSVEARATKDEEDALVNTTAVLLEKYLPTVMGKFGTEATFCFVLLAWGKRVVAIRQQTIAEIEKESANKTKIQGNKIPNS